MFPAGRASGLVLVMIGGRGLETIGATLVCISVCIVSCAGAVVFPVVLVAACAQADVFSLCDFFVAMRCVCGSGRPCWLKKLLFV